jgi:RNA polymerase sigma-70 factor (ECF subfamily)
MATAQFVPSCEFDAAYISGLRAHDPAIENHFVKYFSPILQRKLRRHSSSWILTSDVQQETFTRVLAAIRAGWKIHRPERLGAFVSGVCNNVLFELWRSGRRYQPLENVEPCRADEAMLPHDIFVRGETARQTRLVLSRLSVKNKRLLEAIFFEETDRDQLCEELGVSRTNLRLLLHRAKKQFIDEYNKVWKESRRRHRIFPGGAVAPRRALQV